ncbi:MAG: FdtA/QdtA family cupin domain-containing protein [Paramuribaculum sp.]|nr:FdtA/QdtA family cupin domain-containing protein [Paramuribaculum sp.]
MTEQFQLPEFVDNRGKLTFVEEIAHLPFEISKVYLIDSASVPEKIYLPGKTFLMTPVGSLTIDGTMHFHGIGEGVLADCNTGLSLKVSSGSTLLILSEKPIKSLTPLKLPFRARRVYFMSEIPEGKSRGSHAHLTTSQLIFTLNGKFDVELDNATTKKSVTLTSPLQPVEAPVGVWHTLHSFTNNAVCMVIASELFNPDDYISDYSEFLDISKSTPTND